VGGEGGEPLVDLVGRRVTHGEHRREVAVDGQQRRESLDAQFR
jgi:hypothetical protein